jgi:hypothetical protein
MLSSTIRKEMAMGRTKKLNETHIDIVKNAISSGVCRKNIAKILEVSVETLRQFCIEYEIEQLVKIKYEVLKKYIDEAFKYMKGYFVNLCQRMRTSGQKWTNNDEDHLKNLMCNTVVSCLNAYDESRNAKLSTLLTKGFEHDLETQMTVAGREIEYTNKIESVIVETEQDDAGRPAGYPVPGGENRYFLRPPNAPKKIPPSIPDDDVLTVHAPFNYKSAEEKHDAIREIAMGMRKPRFKGWKSERKTRAKICPYCGTVLHGTPSLVSAPDGLAPDDSRRDPCPFCFGVKKIDCEMVYTRRKGKKYPKHPTSPGNPGNSPSIIRIRHHAREKASVFALDYSSSAIPQSTAQVQAS